MVTKSMKAVVECLYCGEDIQIYTNPKSGSFVTCNKCSSQFEIIDIEPVMIDWPYYDFSSNRCGIYESNRKLS